MRTARMLLLLLPWTLLGGCLPVSLQPLVAREQDSIRDDRILGEWIDEEVHWTVRPDVQGYRAIKEIGDLRAVYSLVLTRLDRELFMDLGPSHTPDIDARYGYHLIQGHSIHRVAFAGDTLRLFILTNTIPDSSSRAAGDTLAYREYVDVNGETKQLIVAETDRLREFLTKHARDERLFDRRELVRLR